LVQECFFCFHKIDSFQYFSASLTKLIARFGWFLLSWISKYCPLVKYWIFIWFDNYD